MAGPSARSCSACSWPTPAQRHPKRAAPLRPNSCVGRLAAGRGAALACGARVVERGGIWTQRQPSCRFGRRRHDGPRRTRRGGPPGGACSVGAARLVLPPGAPRGPQGRVSHPPRRRRQGRISAGPRPCCRRRTVTGCGCRQCWAVQQALPSSCCDRPGRSIGVVRHEGPGSSCCL